MSLKNLPVLLLFAGIIIAVAFGCRKGSDVPAPVITFSFEKDTMHLSIGDSVNIRAFVANSVTVQHSWKLNDSLYSVSYDINIVPKTIGTYMLFYSGGNETATFTKAITIYVGDRIRPITATSSKYISSVLGYLPAPGQFVNETIADANSPQNIIGETNSLLSLGGYGGYVIFTFDHSIVNKDGMDLAIAGNPLAPPMEWSEPGIVMVSHDLNGNGVADDEWD
ncbi:MAG: hypothetical protein EOO02_19300 [Chitinophagaceae bacterium]|nr:MAG: hypothetical protein EOO02_19300 [Chitinophagaceae bacterium]